MATYGSDMKRIWEAKVFKSYSSFYNNTKLNDLFKQSLFLSVQDVYRELSDQVDYDDLISVIRTEQTFGLNSNKIYVAPIQIANIFTVFTNAIITTTQPHNIEIGDFITMEDIAGITTTPSLNGTFTVTNFLHSTTQFSVTTTYNSGTYTANSGAITLVQNGAATVNKMIPDYGDLLSLKAKYSQTLDLQITDAKNTSPIRIKANKRNNIKTGEKLNISNINGNTNANGDFYVKVVNTYEFDLYTDIDLQNPTNGNGTFGGIGKVKRIYYKVATPYISSRKISTYETPTTYAPQFERADTQLKIYPNDHTCEELTMDYIRYDLQMIDVTNSTIDLELTYPYEFLMYVADKAAQEFFANTGATEQFQVSKIKEQEVK